MWDMKGQTSFMTKRDIQGLELPKGTIIEIEVVNELQGEVSILLAACGNIVM